MKSIPSDKNTDVADMYWVVPNENYTHVAHNNMNIFKGSENALNMTKEYFVEWKCKYAYQWYPFDTQACRMEMISRADHTEVPPSQPFSQSGNNFQQLHSDKDQNVSIKNT